MDTRLIKSVLSLAIVLTLAGGVTYAQLQSNTVTLSGNSVTTPDANIKLCDNADSDTGWNSTAAGFSLSGLAPGDEEELTAAGDLRVGNDDGTLATAGAGNCVGYDGDVGDSGVDLNLRPEISFAQGQTCSAELQSELMLSFTLNGGTATVFKTLDEWEANTEGSVNKVLLAPTVEPGQIPSLTIDAKLDAASDNADETCEFDVTLQGEQDQS